MLFWANQAVSLVSPTNFFPWQLGACLWKVFHGQDSTIRFFLLHIQDVHCSSCLEKAQGWCQKYTVSPEKQTTNPSTRKAYFAKSPGIDRQNCCESSLYGFQHCKIWSSLLISDKYSSKGLISIPTFSFSSRLKRVAKSCSNPAKEINSEIHIRFILWMQGSS